MLSDKVHATTPKGLVGGFEFTVFLKKFERMAGEAMDVCLWVLKEINKSRFDSYSVSNIVLHISHITSLQITASHRSNDRQILDFDGLKLGLVCHSLFLFSFSDIPDWCFDPQNLVLVQSHDHPTAKSYLQACITFRDCRVHIFSDNLPRNSRNLVRLENPVQNLPVLLPLDFLDCGFLLALPALGLSFTLASSWIYHNKTRHNKYEDEYVEISNRPWRTIH